MAHKLETPDDWQKLDASRLALAGQEVMASDNLRFLFRQILGMLNIVGPVGAPDAIALAHNTGYRNAGVDILAILEDMDPTLWPQLFLEEVAERNARPTPRDEETLA